MPASEQKAGCLVPRAPLRVGAEATASHAAAAHPPSQPSHIHHLY